MMSEPTNAELIEKAKRARERAHKANALRYARGNPAIEIGEMDQLAWLLADRMDAAEAAITAEKRSKLDWMSRASIAMKEKEAETAVRVEAERRLATCRDLMATAAGLHEPGQFTMPVQPATEATATPEPASVEAWAFMKPDGDLVKNGYGVPVLYRTRHGAWHERMIYTASSKATLKEAGGKPVRVRVVVLGDGGGA